METTIDVHLPKHPLLDLPHPDTALVTLENYEKWYRIFLLQSDGTVSAISASVVERVMGQESLMIDHCFHPRLLLLLAKHLYASVSPVTIEVATGRWVMEAYPTQVPFCYDLDEE